MKDLSNFKFIISDYYVDDVLEEDELDNAVETVWANRDGDCNHLFAAEKDSMLEHEEMIDLGYIKYSEKYETYFWHNTTYHNRNGYIVESPMDIIEVLNVHPIIGDLDYDDPDAPTPIEIADENAITINTDEGFAMEANNYNSMLEKSEMYNDESEYYHSRRRPINEW